jgi:hypothetical protein
MTISCGIYFAANVTQETAMSVKKYDWPGTARIMTIAFCGYGPVLYYWYKGLDKYLPGKSVRTVLAKSALDLFVMSPPCLFLFYVGKCTHDMGLYYKAIQGPACLILLLTPTPGSDAQVTGITAAEPPVGC